MTDTVIAFPQPKPRIPERTRETGVALCGTQPGAFFPGAGRSSAASAPAFIEIDKLYPATKGSPSAVLAALGLLADAIDMMEKARIAAQSGDLVTADRHAQRFQAALPKLFEPRDRK